MNQEGAIKHFLIPLADEFLIKYDSHLANDGLSKYIYMWQASITKKGIDFYLSLREESLHHIPKITTHKTNSRGFIKWIRGKLDKLSVANIIEMIIAGFIVAVLIWYFGFIKPRQ